MLPRLQRLNLKKDFKWVASGKKIDTKFAKLFIRIGENTSPRIGVAVSSKIFKKATQRNRAKRLLSQAFQSTIFHLPSTINIVALPKAGITSVKSQEVLADLKEVFQSEKIIN